MRNSEALDQNDIEAAGRAAFEDGVLATDCPYAFRNTICWEGKDYSRFDREFRWKMNAWMKGWIDAQKAAR